MKGHFQSMKLVYRKCFERFKSEDENQISYSIDRIKRFIIYHDKDKSWDNLILNKKYV